MKRVLGLILLVSCATTGASGKGDENLPSAGVGPFRKLADDEVLGVAPFVLDDKAGQYREPAAILDGASVLLYATGKDGGGARDVIVRSRAEDARSFFGTTLHDVVDVIPGAISFDAHLQWSELVKDTTLKSSPADYVGDYTAQGRIIAAGAMMTVVFDAPGKAKEATK